MIHLALTLALTVSTHATTDDVAAAVGRALEIYDLAAGCTSELTPALMPQPGERSEDPAQLKTRFAADAAVRWLSGDLTSVEGLTSYVSLNQGDTFDVWPGERTIRVSLIRSADLSFFTVWDAPLLEAYLNHVVQRSVFESLGVSVFDKTRNDYGVIAYVPDQVQAGKRMLYVATVIVNPRLMPREMFARFVADLLAREAVIKKTLGL